MSQKDLRKARPFFLVPLGDAGLPGISNLVLQNIKAHVAQSKKVTDIFVLSHGWHRNLFTGVTAYDRLLSRFLFLFYRGRLQKTPSASPPLDFNPMLIALHWNSDPGDDRWTDKSGRRHKASFLANVQEQFVPGPIGEAQFQSDFEDIFEFMTQISAANLNATDPGLDGLASQLTDKLAQYEPRYCPSSAASCDDKVTLLWRCYAESQAKALLGDQNKTPKPVGNTIDALSALGKFIIGLAGLGLVGQLFNKPLAELGRLIAGGWTNLIVSLYGSTDAPAWVHALAGLGMYSVSVSVLFGLLYLWKPVSQHVLRIKQPAGVSIPGLVFYVPLQILVLLPLIVGLLITFIFRSMLVLLGPLASLIWGDWSYTYWAAGGFIAYSVLMSALGLPVPRLFDEKAGSRKGAMSVWRYRSAQLARVPVQLIRPLISPDSRVLGFIEVIDSQIAFYEMQLKGTRMGEKAAHFLDRLVKETFAGREDDPVRIHLIGHSFGGLVVANAARSYLMGNPSKSAVVRSLCLVQAAMASNWFEGQKDWLSGIKGAVSCIYSAKDTANGFYYPLANNGRMAAGFVGLCNTPPHVVDLGKGGIFSMLVAPPPLKAMAPPPPPLVYNLDASRLIYEGGMATGGGHDDIFKDDVVHLLWSACSI